jgi:hypothetical protein
MLDEMSGGKLKSIVMAWQSGVGAVGNNVPLIKINTA